MTAATLPAARVELAARLLVAGLLASAATLVWKSPLSFLAFVFIGGGLSAAGFALFLWTIIVQGLSQRQGD